MWCRGCTTAPPLCPLLPSVHGASSSTGAVTAYISSTKNEISYAMNKVSTTHAKTMVLLRSRKGMILALFETCGPISHVWLPSTHYRRQASRLSGAQAAGRPGTWPPESVRRSSRPSRRGRRRISAGSGTRCIDDWSRDADMPHRVSDGPPLRARGRRERQLLWDGPRRACRRHRRALQRLAPAGPPREPRRARQATREQTKHGRVCPSPLTRTVGRACDGAP